MRKEIQISDVEALWPRLDKPYRFNRQKMESEPCEATADQAKYETSFKMTPEQAKALWADMKSAYDAERAPDWPDYTMPFKKTDDGQYIFKASKKAAYDGTAPTPPIQWDAKATKLPSDFQLTTGSKINMNVKLIPYNGSMGAGVSLRLNALQVMEAAERVEVSPFGATNGSFVDEQPFAAPKPTPKAEDPFGLPPVEAPKASADFDDEIPF